MSAKLIYFIKKILAVVGMGFAVLLVIGIVMAFFVYPSKQPTKEYPGSINEFASSSNSVASQGQSIPKTHIKNPSPKPPVSQSSSEPPSCPSNSSYDSSSNSCPCDAGFVPVGGDCFTLDESCATTYGSNVHAVTSNNSTSCYCDAGYAWNDTKTACITFNDSCAMRYGFNVHAGTSDNSTSCYCDAGYAWNAAKTACVESVPVNTGTGPSPGPSPSPSQTNVTGQWRGTFDATSGSCSGYSGDWSAGLNEQNGNLSGSFDATISSFVLAKGSVSGSLNGSRLSWNVGGGGSGVRFTGNASGNTMNGTFTAICPIDGSGTSGSFRGQKTSSVPPPPPPPPLVCAPQSQTVLVNQDATVTASGGSGTYNWTADNLAPYKGSGPSFTGRTSYYTGNLTVQVSDGSQSASCSVLVCPAPTPPSQGGGPLPYVPAGCPH